MKIDEINIAIQKQLKLTQDTKGGEYAKKSMKFLQIWRNVNYDIQ